MELEDDGFFFPSIAASIIISIKCLLSVFLKDINQVILFLISMFEVSLKINWTCVRGKKWQKNHLMLCNNEKCRNKLIIISFLCPLWWIRWNVLCILTLFYCKFLKENKENLHHIPNHSFLNDQCGWHEGICSWTPFLWSLRAELNEGQPSNPGAHSWDFWSLCIFCGNKIQSTSFQMPLWKRAALKCLVWDQRPWASNWRF